MIMKGGLKKDSYVHKSERPAKKNESKYINNHFPIKHRPNILLQIIWNNRNSNESQNCCINKKEGEYDKKDDSRDLTRLKHSYIMIMKQHPSKTIGMDSDRAQKGGLLKTDNGVGVTDMNKKITRLTTKDDRI